MKTTILALSIFCSLCMSAQKIEIGVPQQLMKGTTSEAYYPVLSEDGSHLLFSNPEYRGLKIYNFDSESVSTISNEASAGYKASFISNDKVMYITKQLSTATTNVNSYDVNNMTSSTLISGTKDIKPAAALLKSDLIKKKVGIKTPKADNERYVYTIGSKVIVGINGVEKEYSPVESQAGYIWSSISPNGKNVMFYAAGKGIVIMDIKGNVINTLGNYEAPVWYGDKYVIAQNAKDDGHQYSSSQIVLLSVDGSIKKEITKPVSMTMYPTASIQSEKVVYNTIDGRLFMVNVSIK